jgi:hypothetical protein
VAGEQSVSAAASTHQPFLGMKEAAMKLTLVNSGPKPESVKSVPLAAMVATLAVVPGR